MYWMLSKVLQLKNFLSREDKNIAKPRNMEKVTFCLERKIPTWLQRYMSLQCKLMFLCYFFYILLVSRCLRQYIYYHFQYLSSQSHCQFGLRISNFIEITQQILIYENKRDPESPTSTLTTNPLLFHSDILVALFSWGGQEWSWHPCFTIVVF